MPASDVQNVLPPAIAGREYTCHRLTDMEQIEDGCVLAQVEKEGILRILEATYGYFGIYLKCLAMFRWSFEKEDEVVSCFENVGEYAVLRTLEPPFDQCYLLNVTVKSVKGFIARLNRAGIRNLLQGSRLDDGIKKIFRVARADQRNRLK